MCCYIESLPEYRGSSIRSGFTLLQRCNVSFQATKKKLQRLLMQHVFKRKSPKNSYNVNRLMFLLWKSFVQYFECFLQVKMRQIVRPLTWIRYALLGARRGLYLLELRTDLQEKSLNWPSICSTEEQKSSTWIFAVHISSSLSPAPATSNH